VSGRGTLAVKACTGVLVLALLGFVASSTVLQNDLSWTGPFAVRVEPPATAFWVTPRSIAAKTSSALVGLWWCEFTTTFKTTLLFGTSGNAATWTDLIEVDEIFSEVLAGSPVLRACLDVLSNGSTVLAIEWNTFNDSIPVDHIALSISSDNDATWGPPKTVVPTPDIASLSAVHQYGGSFRLVVELENAVEIWTLDATLTNITARLHYDLPPASPYVSSSVVFGGRLVLLFAPYLEKGAFVLTTDGSSWERWNIPSSLGNFGRLAVWNNQPFLLHSSTFHMGLFTYAEGFHWSKVLPNNASHTWDLVDTRRIWSGSSSYGLAPVQDSEVPMFLFQAVGYLSQVSLFIHTTNYPTIWAAVTFSVIFVLILVVSFAPLLRLVKTRFRGVRR